MKRISGNTYPVKEQIKALGGRWNKSANCWEVPDDKAEEAQALVKGPARPTGRGPRVCKECGSKINYGVYCGKCEYR